MPMRIAVVGAGLAGASLAWRLRQHPNPPVVDLYSATPAGTDATAASGGLVRGFEQAAGACAQAAESLAELRGDAALREAAAYREVGSTYLLPPGCDPGTCVGTVEGILPGSVTVRDAAAPFRGLQAGTTAVLERHAGYLWPAALRAALLIRLDAAGATIRPVPVKRLDPAGLQLADGSRRDHDLVIVAAGAWTPALLAANGLGVGGLRTKQIQYTVFPGQPPGLGAFVDDTTGLYGRPDGADAVLLGLPCDRWDVDVDNVPPDLDLVQRVADAAGRCLDLPAADPLRTVASFDCYHDEPGLKLRTAPGLLTFTAGSGGAAKTVLAASRAAAAAVLVGRSPSG